MSRSIPRDGSCNGVKSDAVQFRASDGQEALEKSHQMRNSRSQERDAWTPSIDLAVPAGWSHHLHLPVGHLRLNKKNSETCQLMLHGWCQSGRRLAFDV